MTSLDHPSVARVREVLLAAGVTGQIHALDDSARTAAEAAAGLGIEVGQIASSIVFGLPPVEEDATPQPLLVVTSGAHRVDTTVVAALLGVRKLLRADADFVRRWSGFAIGGVSPVGWLAESPNGAHAITAPEPLTVLVDRALAQYDVVWAAAGHPHCVFPTTYDELVRLTAGTPAIVGD
ncbi:MAG: YbaK/EbsC family protein [Actinobacteria bacterium]|nr:YbaK/EbsC family protein [Actinomycetota bacterium]